MLVSVQEERVQGYVNHEYSTQSRCYITDLGSDWSIQSPHSCLTLIGPKKTSQDAGGDSHIVQASISMKYLDLFDYHCLAMGTLPLHILTYLTYIRYFFTTFNLQMY